MPTQPRQFRLPDESIAYLDRIAEYLSRLTGLPPNRTAAVVWAARRAAESIPPEPKKKVGKKS